MDIPTIITALRTLGIGRQYLGYNITIQAVQMVLHDENRLLCIKQGILEPIAEQLQCDWRTIERNIRTIIRRAWAVNRTYLGELAGYPMDQEPTVTEFVEILSAHILRMNMTQDVFLPENGLPVTSYREAHIAGRTGDRRQKKVRPHTPTVA